MSWYDDDDTTSTSDGFGFGLEETTDATESTTDGLDAETTSSSKFGSFKERIGKKNFTLLLILLAGTALVVIVALVFGSDTSKSTNSNDKQHTTQQTIQQPTKKPSAQTSTGYADWKDMTGATFTTGSEKTAQFTVTDYKLYARNSGGSVAPLEVRVEAWGAIAGYDGIYKIDVPYATIAVILEYETSKDEPLSFPVTFKVGTYDKNKVIYDITP